MRRTAADLAIVTTAALATHFAYWRFSGVNFFFPDSVTYLAPARNLLDGFGFATAPGVAETLRTPGYPLFLAVFLALHLGAAAIAAAQHVVSVAVVAAVYLVTRRIGGANLALTAALILAVDPATVHIANKVLSETIFTAGLFALFALALRVATRAAGWLSFAAAGVLAGGLVLVRPVAILYFVVLAAFFAWRGRSRSIALFLAVAVAFPLAWALRNRSASGVFTVSAVAGANMLQHRAAPALAIFDDEPFRQALGERQQELMEDADSEIESRLRIPDATELSPAVRGDWYGRIGRRIASQHPAGLLLVTVRGVLVNLFDSDWEAVMMETTVNASIVQLAVVAWNHAIVFLAMIGVCVLWRRDRYAAGLLFATAAYFVLISAGSEAEYRFRVPVVPMIAIAAAFGADGVRRVVTARVAS